MSESQASGIVKHSQDVESRAVAAGTATETQVLLGPEDGVPHFAMRRFRMGHGGGMPLHTNSVEHQQYVLGGQGRVTIGDRTRDVAPGDVLFIPAGTPHSYEVLEAPFEFLCMVPDQPDRIEIVTEPQC